MSTNLECVSITATQLAQALENPTTVVLDTRSDVQFQIKRIKDSLRLRLSSLLLKRLVSGSISISSVVCDVDDKWKQRESGDLVVVVDDSSRLGDRTPFNAHDHLHVVVHSLQAAQENCVVLHGGIAAFEAAHAALIDRSPLQHPMFPPQFSQSLPCHGFVPSKGFAGCKAQPCFPWQKPKHPASTTAATQSMQTQQQPPPYHQVMPTRAAPATVFSAFCGSPCVQGQPKMTRRQSRPPPIRVQFTESHRSSAVAVAVERTQAVPMTASLERRLTLPMSCIMENLYLGAARDAESLETLRANNITHVLNLTRDVPNFFASKQNISYQQIPIEDGFQQNIPQYFSLAFEFIDMARSRGEGILVHCKAGISRSAAFVIAYVMQHKGVSLDEAYKFVSGRRDIISPNLDFMGDLSTFETQLKQERGQ
eukprot:m.120424 g.120424  ORF g.120424 m.120424 type:complete len:424 (-) comp13688_c0_seq3:271-1542(-)